MPQVLFYLLSPRFWELPIDLFNDLRVRDLLFLKCRDVSVAVVDPLSHEVEAPTDGRAGNALALLNFLSQLNAPPVIRA